MEKLWPPPLEHVVQFIGYMSVKGLGESTARTYVAGIAYHLKINGHVDVTQNFIVKKLLEGYRRKSKTKDIRLSITSNILENILKVLPIVCTNNYEAKLFAAAFSVAFFGYFRVGELTEGRKQLQGHAVQFKHLEISNKHTFLKFSLQHSKADQRGKGETIMIENNHSSTYIKPVDIMLDYLRVRPSVQGNLFCHFGGQALTRVQFAAVLGKALKAIGVDSTRYKSHSFRIGAATNAAMLGISDEDICKAGRWKSKCYKSYIRT